MSGRAERARGQRAITGPSVVALCVVGLLAGGILLLATGRGSPEAPEPSTNGPTPSATPSLQQAQLEGSYRVRLVVRTSRNLASIAGIARPVPGSHRLGVWQFSATCDTGAGARPCPASWDGRTGSLVPRGATWTGTVVGPRAACFGGTRVAGPIELRLVARDAVQDAGAWVVRSFIGSWAVTFHCPGFAVSSGTVEVNGSRIGA